MRKKLALFGGSLVVLAGSFAGLCYLTGINPLRSERPISAVPLDPTTQPQDIPLEYEARDPTGRLEYVLAARRAQPEGQGRYHLDHPKATYYLQNGDLVVVTAEAGALRVDQLEGGTQKMRVAGGSLSGAVQLTVGPADTFINSDDTRQPGQIQAGFTKPIEFNYEDRTIESRGPVHVASDQISFDGANLLLTLNTDQKRIEFMRIEPQQGGGRIVLKNVGQGELAFNQKAAAANAAGGAHADPNPATTAAHHAAAAHQTSAASSVSSGVASIPASTAPVVAPRSTYRLTFGQDVHARLGAAALTAEKLSVLFQTGQAVGNSVGNSGGGPGGKPAAAPPASAAGAPVASSRPVAQSAASQTPIAGGAKPAAEQDLILTWTGPMEMRPVEDAAMQQLAATGMVVEATGSKDHPVLVKTDDGGGAMAGLLRYSRGSDLILLERGALANIELALGNQQPGKIIAPAAAFNRVTHTLALTGGPGRMEATVAAPNGQKPQPLQAAWQQRLDITLQPASAAAVGADSVALLPKLTLRRAVFQGGASISDPTFAIRGDSLDLLIAAPSAVQKKTTLEHLLATGEVRIASYVAGRPKDKANSLQADQVEVSSAADPAGQLSPRLIVASGHVVGVNYDPVAGHPGELAGQKLTTQELTIELADKIATQPARAAAADSLAQAAQMGTFKPQRISATGGVSIELDQPGGAGATGAAAQPVRATAWRLEANVPAGTARLDGQVAGRPVGPAAAQLVAAQSARLEQGPNQIAGQTILLDKTAGTIQIPGPGEFTFVQAAENGKPAAPAQVVWDTRMNYSSQTGEALFSGPVRVTMLGNPEQDSQLSARMLYVSGLPVSDLNGSATRPKQSSQAKIRAEGQVVAENKTYNAQHQLETEMLLRKVDVAIYDGAQQSLLVPGSGEVFFGDYRPEPKPNPKADQAKGGAPAGFGQRGTQAMSWSKRLIYDAGSHQMRAMGDVLVVMKPTHPTTLPLPASGGRTQNQQVDRITLRGQELTAHVAPRDATATANALALGANGGLDLQSVTLQKNATLILNDGVAAVQSDRLSYDRAGEQVTAGGTDMQVRYSLVDGGQGQARQITWDIASGSFTIRGSEGTFNVPAGHGVP